MERTIGGYWIKGLGIIIGIALGLLASADQAQAITCTWIGRAGTNGWNEPGNWGPDCQASPTPGIPGTGVIVRFLDGGSTSALSNQNIPGLSLGGLILNGRSGFGVPWQITGTQTTTLTGNVSAFDDAGNVGPSIQVPLALGANVTIENTGPTPLVLGDIDLRAFTLTVDSHSQIVLGGIISGLETGGLVIDGTFVNALVEFDGDNTYRGHTEIGGIVVTSTLHPFGQSTTPTLVKNGTELRLGGSLANALTPAGDLKLSLADGVSATMSGDVSTVPDSALLVDAGLGANLTITGKIGPADQASITMTGHGTLVLSNPDRQNRFGIIRDSIGTVRVGVPETIPDTAAILLGADATLDLNNVDETVGPIEGNGGTILLGSGKLTINEIEATVLIATIAGTGTLVKSGPERLELIFRSAISATTIVNAGTLATSALVMRAIAGPLVVNGGVALIGGNEFVDTVPVTVNAGGLLDLSGVDITEIGSLAGNGDVQLGQGTRLTIGANNASTTYGGAISGNGNVTKIGTGTLTVTGSSTHPATSIANGTLIVNGTLTDVFVDGGILGGVGTVNSIVSQAAGLVGGANPLAASGSVAPGPAGPGPSPGPGILHASGAFLDDLAFVVDINGAVAGAGYDQLALTEDLQLSETSTLQASLGFQPRKGAQFTLITLAPGKIVNGTFNGLSEGTVFPVGDRHFSISYKGGDGNDVVVTAADDVPAITYFLSEGATGGFFDEDVLLANPGRDAAPVTLTFSKENGEQVVAKQTVPAQSRLTVHVDQIPGLEQTAASVQVTSDAGVPLAVERSMFWDTSYYAGHTGSAVDQPSPDWFFAEGSQGFFDTFVLVINPNATPTTVTFTFFREHEAPVVKRIIVGATTRLTLPAGDLSGLVNRSFGIAVHATQPIMAERSMYFGTTPTRLWSGGSESEGVTAASTHWFLAEGATGGFFDTFVLLSNPQSTPANVTLQYLLDTGETVTVPKTIPANTRLTTNIEAEDDVRLHNAAVSTVVTSDQPIIAERSMYWPGAAVPWGEGHNSFGVTDAGTRWGLAEGRTGGPLKFHTYILLANPQTTDANVKVTFLRETGTPVTQTFTVPKTSRFNIDVNAIEGLQEASFGALIEVTNGVNIIVERSMYWDSNGFLFSGGTNATGIRLVTP